MLSKFLYRVSLPSDRNTTPQEVALASLPETSQGRTARSACFALLVGLTLAAFWAPISMLIRFSF